MANKKRATKNGAPNKSAFVRSLPAGTTYDQAMEKAKPLGIELSKAYFYVLKSEAKKVRGKSNGHAKPHISKRAAKLLREGNLAGGLRLSSDDKDEEAVIQATRALGADRARAVIEAVEKFEA